MARILLINPPKDVPLLDWAMRYPPLGLLSIAAVLQGHEVEILDLKVDRIKDEELKNKMSQADVVGISVLTPSVDSALELCRQAKQYRCLTVLGGVHPSLVPELVEKPEVDIVVRGEGELSFKEICDGKSLKGIAGISYKEGGRVVHNPERAPAKLSDLPPPRRDFVAKYRGSYKAWGKRLDAISTARGCPYHCSFCCVPQVWKGYRERPPHEVVNELKQLDPDAEIIAFVDDNFCSNMKRVEQICDLIIQEGLNDRLYSCFSRIDSIVSHPEVVEKMHAANLRVVFIGIEAASQESLDTMKKHTRLDDISTACRILEEKGMMIWAGHIIGNLEDTYEDVEALITLSQALPLDIAQFTVITPYPGTDLYKTAREQHLIDTFDYTEYCECEPPMHTPHLTRIELLELEMKAYLGFYGFWAVYKRLRRWSKNPAKRWLLENNMRTFREFGRYWRTSAFYFVKAYKEMLAETEGTAPDTTPLLAGPKSFSLAAGVIAGLITLFVTILIDHGSSTFMVGNPLYTLLDNAIASIITAGSTALVATWLTVKMYRRGWILSFRQRKSGRSTETVGDRVGDNALRYSVIAGLLMTIYSATMIATNLHHSMGTLGMKEIPVTLIAFFTSFLVSFTSIDAVRRKEVI